MIRVVCAIAAVGGGGAATWYFGFSEHEETPPKRNLPIIDPMGDPHRENGGGKKTDNGKPDVPGPLPAVLPPVSELDVATIRRIVVGSWEQDHKGHWELHAQPDGRCLVIYEPSFLRRLAIGKRVEIDMVWDIKAGALTLTSSGGRPEAAYKAVIRQVGKVQNLKLLKLQRDEMQTSNSEGKPDTPWVRMKRKAE